MIYKRNEQYGLPQTGVLNNGQNVSNYNLLPTAVLEAEGWQLVEEPVIEPIEIEPTIEEQIELLANQVMLAQEALDFLIMGGL